MRHSAALSFMGPSCGTAGSSLRGYPRSVGRWPRWAIAPVSFPVKDDGFVPKNLRQPEAGLARIAELAAPATARE